MIDDQTQIQQVKNSIRRQIIQQLKQLSDDDLLYSNQLIFNQLIKLDAVNNASTVFCYVSIDREIDTRSYIQYLLAQGKTVCVPKCHDSRNMDAYQIQSIDDLVAGKYAIPTAKAGCRLVAPNEIDIGIIPGLSVDLSGNRLGYGNGFYDIYFSRANFTKLMLCRKALMVDAVPMQPWDKPIDILVNEETLIYFK